MEDKGSDCWMLILLLLVFWWFFFPLLYMTNDVKSLFLYGPCFIRLMHMKKPAFNHFLTKMAIYMV